MRLLNCRKLCEKPAILLSVIFDHNQRRIYENKLEISQQQRKNLKIGDKKLRNIKKEALFYYIFNFSFLNVFEKLIITTCCEIFKKN